MEDAVARRERLKALKQAALAEQSEEVEKVVEENAEPILKFRNYEVKDDRIAHEKVEPAQPPKLEEPVVENQLDAVNQEELLANIATKKANWDLKRDIAPKLEKLERRTLKAIYDLIQEEQSEAMREGGVAD